MQKSGAKQPAQLNGKVYAEKVLWIDMHGSGKMAKKRTQQKFLGELLTALLTKMLAIHKHERIKYFQGLIKDIHILAATLSAIVY